MIFISLLNILINTKIYKKLYLNDKLYSYIKFIITVLFLKILLWSKQI